MAAEDFFRRWASFKTKPELVPGIEPGAELPAAVPAAVPTDVAPAEPVESAAPAAPTMADVASLTEDSDYAPFVARGVDQAVQRSAMKKLFSDPHYNIMDGLDIYIGDYNTFEPIPEAMLAMLEHAKGVLDPLSMFEKPMMELLSLPKLDLDLDLELAPAAEAEPEVLTVALATVDAAATPDTPGLDSKRPDPDRRAHV